MSNSTNRFTVVLLVLFFIGVILLSIQVIFTENSGIIPILGLPNQLHTAFFSLIWPFFGSAIFALVCPRIFTPMYLGLKGKILPDYKNGQVEFESNPDSLKK